RPRCCSTKCTYGRMRASQWSGHGWSSKRCTATTVPEIATAAASTIPTRGTQGRIGGDGSVARMEVERALVVSAHPDDVDFGAAGTVATWTDAGVEVTYCIVTDGDAGGFDPAVPRSEIPGIRRAEQTAAAAVVGVHDLEFLGYPDGALEVSIDLRRDISRVIRRVR